MNLREKNTIEQLTWLLEASTPNALQRSIQTIMFAYIFEQERNGLEDDFKTNVENCQLLIRFFQTMEA